MSEEYNAVFDRRHPKYHRKSDFESCPRYLKHELTEEQIEQIAVRAASKAASIAAVEAMELTQRIRNEEIGRFVTNKFYVAVGMIAFAAWAWLTKNGYLR